MKISQKEIHSAYINDRGSGNVPDDRRKQYLCVSAHVCQWNFPFHWSVFFMLRNGVMIGAFEYYFFNKGLGAESVLTIWIHGTLEISGIIIAGAAGLVLATDCFFLKHIPDFSFQNSAKDGTKIALGLVPIILVAAFFEGFITRHTECRFCSASVFWQDPCSLSSGM
jgi:hypothetical protein